MPAGQPFTALCQAAARCRPVGRIDLHIHTTFSDGTYTAAQVVELARRSGLAAVALTDHDTLDGLAPARTAAGSSGLEIVPGVEITAEHAAREFHLLGYFVRPDDVPLRAALRRLAEHRVGRFLDMVERLRRSGVSLDTEELRPHLTGGVPGRRHLAELLVRARRAGSVREAFARYLGDGGRVDVPKLRLPLDEALALVRGAGGVAAWAHPAYDCNRAALAALKARGLGAVEAEYPGFSSRRVRELRAWAAELGLAVTGGSDCHGPEPAGRAVGACGISGPELDALRRLASP
jgi:predicted metal-dependent phosphoesterase TrpH